MSDGDNSSREPVFGFLSYEESMVTAPRTWVEFVGNSIYPLNYANDDVSPQIVLQDSATTTHSNMFLVAADNHVYNGSGATLSGGFIKNDLSSGITEISFGNTFNGVPIDQQSHIADASTSHALNATFSDTEVEAALDALGTKINAVIAVVEANKLTATS